MKKILMLLSQLSAKIFSPKKAAASASHLISFPLITGYWYADSLNFLMIQIGDQWFVVCIGCSHQVTDVGFATVEWFNI